MRWLGLVTGREEKKYWGENLLELFLLGLGVGGWAGIVRTGCKDALCWGGVLGVFKDLFPIIVSFVRLGTG